MQTTMITDIFVESSLSLVGHSNVDDDGDEDEEVRDGQEDGVHVVDGVTHGPHFPDAQVGPVLREAQHRAHGNGAVGVFYLMGHGEELC